MKKHKVIKSKDLKEEGRLTVAILVTIFSLLFIMIGILIICLSIKSSPSKTNTVFGIISGLFFIAIFSFFIYYNIHSYLKDRKKEYFIAVDKLKKHVLSSKSDEGTKADLYFEKYYDLFNKIVKVNNNLKENTEDNEKYYLIISPTGLVHKVYNSKEYQISKEVFDKVIKIEDLEEYTKIKKYNSLEKEEININRIIKDVYDEPEKDRKKVAIFINLLILIISFTYCLLNLPIGLLLFLVYIVDSIIIIISLRNEVNTIKAIRNKDFTIKKAKLNEKNKKEEYYIVFLNSNEKLLQKYNINNNYLADNLEAVE